MFFGRGGQLFVQWNVFLSQVSFYYAQAGVLFVNVKPSCFSGISDMLRDYNWLLLLLLLFLLLLQLLLWKIQTKDARWGRRICKPACKTCKYSLMFFFLCHLMYKIKPVIKGHLRMSIFWSFKTGALLIKMKSFLTIVNETYKTWSFFQGGLWL